MFSLLVNEMFVVLGVIVIFGQSASGQELHWQNWTSDHPSVLSNRAGKVNFSLNLGTVEWGALDIPFQVVFDSSKASSNKFLGPWGVPLFSSMAIRRGDGCIEVVLPNGDTRFFSREGSDGLIRNSGGWEASVEGDNFIMRSASNPDCSYRFSKGRLKRYTEKSKSLVWDYDQDGLPVSLSDGDGVIVACKQEKSGPHKRYYFDMSGERNAAVITSVEPDFANLDFLKMQRGIMTGVESIVDCQGRQRILTSLTGEETSEIEVDLGGAYEKKMKVAWDTASGDVVGCNGLEVQVSRMGEGACWPIIASRLSTEGWLTIQEGKVNTPFGYQNFFLDGSVREYHVLRNIGPKPTGKLLMSVHLG